MSSALKSVWLVLQLVRALPVLLLARLTGTHRAIHADSARWIAVRGWEARPGMARPTVRAAVLLGRFPEFRSLVLHRLGRHDPVSPRLARLLYRPQVALHLECPEIGTGLYLQHGFATVVQAERIGRNCHINQQVTVGWGRGGRPTIGDGVAIYAGAVVFGKITLGDRCIVGANATVNRDVPPGATVAGNPAVVVATRDTTKPLAPG